MQRILIWYSRACPGSGTGQAYEDCMHANGGHTKWITGATGEIERQSDVSSK